MSTFTKTLTAVNDKALQIVTDAYNAPIARIRYFNRALPAATLQRLTS